MANKRHSDASHATTLPKRGFFIVQDPTAGATEKFDAGHFADVRNALAPRGGVHLDGTANSRITSALAGQNIGTDAFSIYAVIRVPSSNPAAAIGIANLASSATSFAVSGGVGLGILANGSLVASFTDGANFREKTVANFVSNYAGKVVHVAMTRSGSTVEFYVNGLNVTSTDGGGIPSFAQSIASTYFGVGYLNPTQVYTQPIYSASVYNLGLSASDIEEIYFSGGNVPFRLQNGSQSALLSAASSGFDAGHSWTAGGGASIAGGKATLTNSSAGPIYIDGLLSTGRRYRVGLTIDSGANVFIGWAVNPDLAVGAAAGTYALEFTPQPGTAVPARLGLYSTGNAVIDNVTLTRIGAVVHLPLNDGFGLVARDDSANKLDAILTSAGVAWTQPTQRAALTPLRDYINSLSGADYLQSDGTTSNRRIETQYGTAGAVAGSDLSEVDYVFDVPTSNPGSHATVFAFCLGNSSHFVDQVNSMGCMITSSGSLYIKVSGPASVNDMRVMEFAGWRAANAGRRVRLTVVFTGNSATNPVVYQDGVDISASFVLTTSGTVPNWGHATLATTYHLRFYNWPAGYFRAGRPVTRKYAQADVDFVQMSGRIPASDAMGGSMVAQNTSNFVYGASDGALTITGNSPTGFTASGGASSAWTYVRSQPQVQGTAGRRFRLRGTISGLTGTGHTLSLVAGSAAQGQLYALANGSFDTTMTSTGSGTLGAEFNVGNGGSFTLSNFSIIPVGALSEPIIQAGPVLDDATGRVSSLLVGFTPVSNRTTGRLRFSTNTNGNQAALGASVVLNKPTHLLRVRARARTGTPTVTLGVSSGAAQVVASTALTNTWRNLPIVLSEQMITIDWPLWVGSNSTDIVDWDIEYQPLVNN